MSAVKKYRWLLIPLTLCVVGAGTFFLFPQSIEAVDETRLILEPVDPSGSISAAAAAKEGGSECSLFNPFSWPTCLAASLGQLLIYILGMVLWVSGQFLDFSIYLSVVNFSTFADMPAVTEMWAKVRDFANIFFIFILLYIAIGTILQVQGIDPKRMVIRVIIIAILINFSRVLTGVVIDAGNVVAFQFYKGLRNNDTSLGVLQETSISSQFVEALSLNDPLVPPSEEDLAGNTIPDQGAQGGFLGVIIHTLGASVLIVVASFIFFAAAILFMMRLAVLVIIIILSPLAFLFYAFPSQEGQYKKWQSQLINQTMFAPAYLFLTYIVVKIITSDGFKSFEQIEGGGISGVGMNAIATIIKFVIVTVFLLSALVIAKQFGAYGAQQAAGWSKRFHGMLAANTVGRAGAALARSERLRQAGGKGGVGGKIANTTRNLGRAAANSNFGDKSIQSFNQRVKNRTDRQNLGDYAGDTESQARILSRLSANQKREYYNSLKAEDRGKLEASTINDARLAETLAKLRGKLPEGSKEKKDTEKELEKARRARDEKDALKNLKEGRVALISSDGKTLERDAEGGVTFAPKEKEAEQKALKKLTKLIKPTKDNADDVAEALNSKHGEDILKSFTPNQLRNFLSENSLENIKDADGTITKVKEVLDGLDDTDELKKYARSAPFAPLLGLKKLPVSPETQTHLDVLKKSVAELKADALTAPDIKDLAEGPERDAKITQTANSLREEALRAIPKKEFHHVAPLLSIKDPADKERVEHILKASSETQAKELARYVSTNQRATLDAAYKDVSLETEGSPHYDPHLAEQLRILNVHYKDRSEGEPIPQKGTGSGGAVGGATYETETVNSQPVVPTSPRIITAPSYEGATRERTTYTENQTPKQYGSYPPPARTAAQVAMRQTAPPPPPSPDMAAMVDNITRAQAPETSTLPPLNTSLGSDLRKDTEAEGEANREDIKKKAPETEEEAAAAWDALAKGIAEAETGKLTTERGVEAPKNPETSSDEPKPNTP